MQAFVRICALATVFASSLLCAQTQRRFERFSTDDGLSQSNVRSILRDYRGFMWFGTDDGLNKYDGYRFVTFKRDPEDPGSLSDNYVRVLYEDQDRVLWVGTNMGLNALDRTTGTFRRYFTSPRGATEVARASIHAIAEDPEGYLWVATNGGLRGLDPGRKEAEVVPGEKGNGTLPEEPIRSLHLDRDGRLWIGGLSGIRIREKGLFRRPVVEGVDPSAPWIVRDFADDPARDGMWIATSTGLFFHDRARDEIRPATAFELSGESVRALHFGPSGSVWVGTQDSGLAQIPPTGEMGRPLGISREGASPGSNEIRSVYEDATGLLWVGTFGSGVYRVDLKDSRFAHYHSQGFAPAIGNDTVRSFYEDASSLWIGTDGGVNRFDRASRSYTYHRHDPKDPHSLSHDSVYSIVGGEGGSVWVGTFGGGLNRFDPVGER
ncbi:MAG TPA: two-component regulator propeller domain-containing protein, partial [Vicinamibacteria bacterium]